MTFHNCDHETETTKLHGSIQSRVLAGTRRPFHGTSRQIGIGNRIQLRLLERQDGMGSCRWKICPKPISFVLQQLQILEDLPTRWSSRVRHYM